ncbi:hypothetical protein LTR50_004280 [Elasticomyces elasticus]|nr:hypothetical protein LTR50_004280 [Elasticomyces elasticus]
MPGTMPDPPQASPITRWLIDTRSIWPGNSIQKAAPEALALISPAERQVCVRKMQLQDAKMSLASALLKRLYVSQTLGIPWAKVQFKRKGNPIHGKPCAVLPDGTEAECDFNVSHQAGLVTLVGFNPALGGTHGGANGRGKRAVEVGVDITCVNERDDYRTIDAEGFDSWVDIYSEVFSEEERWDIKYNVDYITLLDGAIVPGEQLGRADRCVKRDVLLTVALPDGSVKDLNSDLLIDAKLRRFYTFFAYKEAYIKLAGEALLAPWLKALEFRSVRSPKPGTVARCSTLGTWGERVDDVEVWLHDKRVEGVSMEMLAFEEDRLIATAIDGWAGPMPEFKKLHIAADVLPYAREH